MNSSTRALGLVSLASLGWAVSFGLGAQLSPLWITDVGYDASTTGANTSLYYLGVAIASPLVPCFMRRANRSCVVLGMCLDALTTALFPFCQGAWCWHLLRFLGGVGTALSLIPMETLVNHKAPPEYRARHFGIYAFCVALGIGLGASLGLPIYPHAPHLAFVGAGAVTLLAIALAWPALSPRHELEAADGKQTTLLWRGSMTSLGTAWVQGFLEGGSLTFLALFLLREGFSESLVGHLVGCLFVGVILAQLPVSWLGDRLGKMRVLLGCHALLILGLSVLPWLENAMALGTVLLVLGACCGALYPLGLALLGERLPREALASGNAWYLASNCAGSLSGPLVMGLVIDVYGLSSQFLLGIAGILIIVPFGLLLDHRPRERLTPTDVNPTSRAA